VFPETGQGGLEGREVDDGGAFGDLQDDVVGRDAGVLEEVREGVLAGSYFFDGARFSIE
jgi:hypothetical protein